MGYECPGAESVMSSSDPDRTVEIDCFRVKVRGVRAGSPSEQPLGGVPSETLVNDGG
jgi:hypothetical protein